MSRSAWRKEDKQWTVDSKLENERMQLALTRLGKHPSTASSITAAGLQRRNNLIANSTKAIGVTQIEEYKHQC